MSRVVKDADVRRKELLDTAMGLFMQDGYERASVEMITAAVGVSKGTFYHYFDSKQDLLADLGNEYSDFIFTHVEQEMRADHRDAAGRLGTLMRSSATMKAEMRDETLAFSRSLYSEENLRLRTELMATWAERLAAILTGLIEEGIAEGCFHVNDARWTADIFVSLWLGWADRHARDLVTAIEGPPELLPPMAEGLGALEEAMERILGVPESSLDLGFREALGAYLGGRPAASA
jgi:AcrR family transcriptional regulator